MLEGELDDCYVASALTLLASSAKRAGICLPACLSLCMAAGGLEHPGCSALPVIFASDGQVQRLFAGCSDPLAAGRAKVGQPRGHGWMNRRLGDNGLRTVRR